MTDGKAEGSVGDIKYDSSKLSQEYAIEYEDRVGGKLKLRRFEDFNFLFFSRPELLRSLKDFKFRDDDVYLSAFPRTGTNWTNDMMKMLQNGKAETITGIKPHLEVIPADDLDKIPSPRVLNTHLKMSKAPSDYLLKKCKTVVTVRDPKDVAVSLYKITAGSPWADVTYNSSFSDYLDLFLDGRVEFNGLFEHWRDAETFFTEHPEIPVLYMVYEETIQDPVGAVQKLSDFLGLEREDELCQAIAEKCNFKTMKADKDKYTLKVNGEDVMFRQGKPGDWQNYFSDELLDKYYKTYDEKMSGSMFYSLYKKK